VKLRHLACASTFVLTVAMAGQASADDPKPAAAATTPATPEAQEQARLHFTAGVNLLQDPGSPRYDEAYAEFKRAYEFVPSYKILGNIALCAMKLERDAEAVEAYTRYLAEAKDLEAEERSQAERDLVTLKAGLARVTVESHPDGIILHDTRVTTRGEPITNVYGPITGKVELGIRIGHHVIKGRYPDGTELVWELDVRGGENHVFDKPAVVAPPPMTDGIPRDKPAASRPVPKSVYIAGIATGVVGVAALVTGIAALDTHSRFQTANDGTQPNRADDLQSSGTTLNVVSDVLLLGTLAGVAVTTYLYLSRPTVSPRAQTGIFVGPGGVAGRF
jgi:hypothetical protein